ncbi:hypothetical protein BN2497_7719 [Janthinobacterium sp. CG23_2]|nr:hypothetical protein BN2497_7719 [Janthinobacterium sp. CG23_2]CUU30257.1 hypothetical protein BN3177_7719 [Janthinobacterium sp. CG23_2]
MPGQAAHRKASAARRAVHTSAHPRRIASTVSAWRAERPAHLKYSALTISHRHGARAENPG